MTITSNHIALSSCELHYLEAGADNTTTLVFLHGFPEFAGCWHRQLDYFKSHFRVIAPDLPGYNLSQKPKAEDFYQVPNLISILAEFIDRVSPSSPVILIAHDWGGALAWPLTAFYPQLISQLVILNAAHPSTFTREMKNNPEQRRRSRYILDLIADNAVNELQKNNFAFLTNLCLAHRTYQPEEHERQVYIDAWSQIGAVEGMLQYYKNMPQLVLDEDEEKLNQLRIPDIRIDVPTTVIWGMEDRAFVPEVLDGLDRYVTDITVRRLQGATHWLHHECADQVNVLINRAISRQ
ncbi:alpha/beta fold hydrolase [Aestuariibacter salexigens]|uniref:alpha/beta fold hydrolase n=1 Tax=Aestuariibacter salexigens TaxID=226010 RepID=UPI0004013010|nr:alpha/beta hydrolase [Aestuariibacter salexigens]